MLVLEVILWLLTVIVLVPMVVLAAESLAALLPPRQRAKDLTTLRPRCAVLIPAHDEEAGIGSTVSAVLPQLGPGDCLLVVADNCQDNTAAVASALGARVAVRTDPEKRGKGFALDFGVRQLESQPPEVVVIVDADCLVQDGALDTLVRQAAHGRPAQAAYVLAEPPEAGNKQRLSAFAFKYKNVVRPLGLDRLGFPCLLTGTGMAFPWPVLAQARLASGNIVEDMQLGLDLAEAGCPPQLCPQAQVRGELPVAEKAAVAQRRRWEHGHLQTLLTQVPRLLAAAVRGAGVSPAEQAQLAGRLHHGWRRRFALLGLALELSVPPLSLLALLWALVLGCAVLFWYLEGSPLPAIVLACAGLMVLLAVFAAWFKFGRERLPLTALLAAPLYVLWKVPIYLAFFVNRQRNWNRTQRRT